MVLVQAITTIEEKKKKIDEDLWTLKNSRMTTDSRIQIRKFKNQTRTINPRIDHSKQLIEIEIQARKT